MGRKCIRFFSAIAVAVTLISACANIGQTSATKPDDGLSSWKTYGGDNGNTQYSSLSQINRDNASQLELAWTYASAQGADIPVSSELQVNPIIVNGILYGRSPNYNVFAVHADSGKPVWIHEAALDHAGLSFMRGLTYWENQRGTQQRIFSTTSHYLTAMNALNGEIISDFGDNGRVDLRAGLGRDIDKVSVYAPSPGVIYKDLLIMGSAVNETRGAAPGDIRAYHVLTGELVWSFHTIPRPGEFGYDSWPEDYWQTGGGANAWAGLSVDAQRGIVYAPTGSATPDFDGSKRHGSNLFANTILALDASTGERRWHYQTVHHDIWDRDLSSAPTLATIRHNGKDVDVVVQASKQGVLYVLDRDTGEPIFPIEEVTVPRSEIPGEQAYPTQPKVTLPEPFTRQAFTTDEITDINPQAKAHVTAQYEQAAEFAYYRPFGLQPTILFPGFYGGGNWGGGAIDIEDGTYYINAMEDASLVKYDRIEVDKGSTLGFGEYVYKKHCGGCHGDKLQGFYPYAPSLVDIAQTGNRRAALEIVNAGKGRMMPFSHLSRHEQNAALEYLFNLSSQLSSGADTSAPKNADAGKKETVYVFGGYTPFMDNRYYPAVKPPWGTLNAIDLNTGKRKWQVTLGEYEQLTQEGVPPTGTRNYGGPVVTQGGLLIIAATSDEKLRIFDKTNGKLLWEYALPAAGYATPATYEINGKQYIVIACPGGKLGTQAGDQYLAFALPD